jgi:hypothetical protein
MQTVRFTNKVLLLLVAVWIVTTEVPLHSELIFRDALGNEWDRARDSLIEGGEREVIARRLASVVEQNRESSWHDWSVELVGALNNSATKLERLKTAGVGAKDSPWLWLAESKMPRALVSCQPINRAALAAFVKEHPDDPASMVLSYGREIIPRLIPLLEDMSPTRSGWMLYKNDFAFVRVCDLAQSIIELKSGCSFCEDTFSQGHISKQSATVRKRTRDVAQKWWNEAGAATYEQGIRAGMNGAGYYGKVRMAALLIDSGQPEDREFAVRVLRALVDEYRGIAIHPGEVLEKHGDTSFRKEIVRKLKESFSAGRFGIQSDLVFFLSQHGGKEEWSLITQCIEAQLSAGEGDVLPTLLNSNRVKTSKYAIPACALALRAKRVDPKIFYDDEKLRREKIWEAVVNLQSLTGESFGATAVVPEAGEWERVTARAEAWWNDTGKVSPLSELRR